MLVGSNGDEGTLFFALGQPIADDAAYQLVLESFYPGKSAAILAQYPSAKYGSAQSAVAHVFGDAVFVCPSRRAARAYAKAGVPTYLYHFTYKDDSAALPGLGSFHTSELPFVFGNPSQLQPENLNTAERALSASMMGYWGRFAAGGDPGGEGALAFPEYDAAKDQNLTLDLTISVDTGLAKAECDFWDTL